MGEQGCLTNKRNNLEVSNNLQVNNLEVSNNLQVNKFTDKIIYDFQKITSAGIIDLNKPLIIIDSTSEIELTFKDGMNGQMIMLINYGGSNVNFKKENGNDHQYKNSNGNDTSALNSEI